MRTSAFASSDSIRHGSVRQAKAQPAFADNRPTAAAQRKLAELANNGPLAMQQKAVMDAVQRKTEEEPPLQGKFEAVQRVEEEEKPLQGKFSSDMPAQLEPQSEARPNKTGLPDNLKSGIESLSGMSMDGVKVHYNSPQPAQLNAHAYAQGSDIHVAPGQERHLPHEAWHVVQQAQGRVQATMQMKDGVPVNDDAGLEHEADVMGAQAVQRRIHIGNEPDEPNDYREITDSEGSTTAHYGGGPMNIAVGIYANNLANAGDEDFPDYVVGGMSDHSEKSLLDRTSASDLDPEIDHIVPVADHGSNSYSNARVLSKSENNNDDANRPGDDDIVIRAHHAIRIRDNNGHDSTTAEGDALDDTDAGMVETFGGIGAVIGANSGTVSNHVRINEV